MRADVEGRMSKALQGEKRFQRWGKHYLRALARAHQLQVCTNFMDPGVQVYGGGLFRSLRQEGDETFLALPRPQPAKDETLVPCEVCGQEISFSDYGAHIETCTPARARARPAGGAALPPAPTPARRPRSPSPDMRTYYAGSGGGCFGPSSSVTVLARDGRQERRLVSDVRAGDEVLIPDGTARVRCAVRVLQTPGRKSLVELPGGLSITPGHPVRLGGVWRRPRDLPEAKDAAEGTPPNLYNFLLDRGHVLLVNGVECVTWGHGLTGDVVEHPYFGTERVVADLAQLPGWERGDVEVGGCFRDAQQRVVRLVGPETGCLGHGSRCAGDTPPERCPVLAC